MWLNYRGVCDLIMITSSTKMTLICNIHLLVLHLTLYQIVRALLFAVLLINRIIKTITDCHALKKMVFYYFERIRRPHWRDGWHMCILRTIQKEFELMDQNNTPFVWEIRILRTIQKSFDIPFLWEIRKLWTIQKTYGSKVTHRFNRISMVLENL